MPDIQAEEIILDEFDGRTGFVQWADIVAPGSTPDGKLLIMNKGDWSSRFVLSKYNSHISKYNLLSETSTEMAALEAEGRGYNEVPKTNEVLNLPDSGLPHAWKPDGASWPYILDQKIFPNGPLTAEQGEEKGNIADLRYPVNICETGENWHATSPHWPFMKPFFDKWRQRLNNKFGPENVWLSADYLYGLKYRLSWMGRQEAKDRLRQPLNTWPGNVLLPGGALDATNVSCNPIYLGAMDTVKDLLFSMAYSGMCAHKANKKHVSFIFPVHEQRPNNYYYMDVPNGGHFAKQDKVPVSPGYASTITSISYVFLDGIIGWGMQSKFDAGKIWNRDFSGSELYFPPGSTTPADLSTFPYAVNQKDMYWTYTGVEDMIVMTVAALSRTWGLTTGGTKRFLKFRKNGGAWYNPVNADADDLVNADWDKHGLVYARTLGNTMSWWYCDPFADNTTSIIEFEHPTIPGQIYTVRVGTNIAKFGNIIF